MSDGLKLKIGDKAYVYDNTSDHGFELGEVVTITGFLDDDCKPIAYRADNADDWWIVDDGDVHLYMEQDE